MHHIHHTEGLILESREQGESGRRFVIFTRELGLIYARATGVRTMSSKLRFVLTDFACVKADLVEGRNYWRVTSASKTGKLERLVRRRAALRVLGNIAALLKRLLVPAEPNEKLFEDLMQGLAMLEDAGSDDGVRNTEAIIVLRMLHDLGYIGDSAALHDLVRSPLEEDLVYRAAAARSLVLKEINKALRESHM